jgi:hypothetical protein
MFLQIQNVSSKNGINILNFILALLAIFYILWTFFFSYKTINHYQHSQEFYREKYRAFLEDFKDEK